MLVKEVRKAKKRSSQNSSSPFWLLFCHELADFEGTSPNTSEIKE
jgi:hypothetical protein